MAAFNLLTVTITSSLASERVLGVLVACLWAELIVAATRYCAAALPLAFYVSYNFLVALLTNGVGSRTVPTYVT